MKKKLALLFAIIFVVSLFAGCDTAGETPGSTPTSEITSAGSTGSAAPDEDSPYTLAAGKYPVDEKGFPTGKYEYEFPLSTTDEVFTMWTTSFSAMYIPEEGYGSMPFPTDLKLKTGVNIEYIIAPNDKRQEQFSVLLASDSLADITSGAISYYHDTPQKAIDDGYFANLYDYKEYCPNYIYEATRYDDPSIYNRVFYNDTTIATFYMMYYDPIPSIGFCTRGDFLDELGLNSADITTFDEMHDMLTRYKNELDIQWPMELFQYIEQAPGAAFGGYDTAAYLNPFSLPPARVIDGEAQFTMTQQDDLDLMTMLSSWYSEGLIDPGWQSNTKTADYADKLTTNQTALTIINPGEISGLENDSQDADARWEPLLKPGREEGQVKQYGSKVSHFGFGSSIISGKCENIPLVASWCDYFYSEEGSFYTSYGVEGYTWEYNDDGEVRLTDYVLNHPAGIIMCLLLNNMNALSDFGLEQQTRGMAYDGGERLLAMRMLWKEADTYGGEYDWPEVNFSQEEKDNLALYQTDIITYISEAYPAFLDGSRPMSEWDSYVQELNGIGLDKCLEIYQDAYDSFLANVAN